MSLGTLKQRPRLTLDNDEDEEIQVCNTSKLFVQVLWNEGEDGIFCRECGQGCTAQAWKYVLVVRTLLRT
jgi:hypothetical protein